MPDGHGLLTIGYIAKAHGLRGDVIVHLVTDQMSRLDPGTVLVSDHGELTVVSSRPHGTNYIVVFEELSNRTEAERFHGSALCAPPLEVDGVLWVHELVGAEVLTTEGVSAGVVTAVEANPASDLLVTDRGHLIPLRFVVSHVPNDTIVVEVPLGLLET